MGGKTITVTCQCGQLLADYYKAGPGRLQKMYLSRITTDRCGLFIEEAYDNYQVLYCPSCNKSIGTIRHINRKIALKVNHGAVSKIRT